MDPIEREIDLAIEEERQSKKKAKIEKEIAECWKYFTKIGVGTDGKQRASCNGCKKQYVIGGHKVGTSFLNRHMGRCHKLNLQDVGQMIIDNKGKLKSRKIDHLISREMCATLILRHDLPFSFVEYKELRAWAKYLNPDAIPISRNTAKADVLKIYMKEKAKLREEMTSIPFRISLTSDLWTACNSEGYICLTAHYVDYAYKLKSKIINFCHMPPPHTGFELSKKIKEFLIEWGIEKKLFCLTLDNASANDVMQHTLKSQLVLQNNLLCDGQFFAHILNLIVQEGLKVASDALYKIREIMKFVRGHESRLIKFKECIAKECGVDASSSSGLSLDVPTRWNSTYLMLQSALKYQRVFDVFCWSDDINKYAPTLDEWKRGKKICKFLLPFYEITTLISGTSYPTSNLYFLQVWKIQCVIMESVRDEDGVIKDMANRMMVKFDKYWDEYSIVLALGAVLDPRLKLITLGICYETSDPNTWELKLEKVKSRLHWLFSEYSIKVASSNALNTIQNTSSTPPNPSLFDVLRVRRQQVSNNIGRSELDIYLDEPPLEIDFMEQMDVLKWWKNNRSRFPQLCRMAVDLLSIPITTVASESAFSIGSRILNKYRSRLLSKNVEALICTRNWMNGFNYDDEDDKVDNDVDNSASDIVNVESNDDDDEEEENEDEFKDIHN